MANPITIQGRQLTRDYLAFIQGLTRDNPSWHRTKLSKHLCQVWQWHAANGQPKDMACRTMLRKLAAKELIDLSAPRRASGYAPRATVDMLHDSSPIEDTLREIAAIRLIDVRRVRYYQQLATCFLAHYHYLGHERPVGESMCYLALDRHERPIAVLLFGAAAWKTQVRDDFIDWGRRTDRGRTIMAVHYRPAPCHLIQLGGFNLPPPCADFEKECRCHRNPGRRSE